MKPGIQLTDECRPMAQRLAAVRLTRRYGASPARVFDAWLDPHVASRWLFATATRPLAYVAIDARVDGSFCFVDRRIGDSTRYTGEYVEIVPHRRLAFTLCTQKYPHVDTRVVVAITPFKTGCELTLTHERVPREHVQHMLQRWTGVLYGLGATLDSASATFHHDQE